MRFAGALVPAFADDLAVAHQHTTDARIGAGGVQAAFRQVQRTRHPLAVLRRRHQRAGGLRRLAGDLRTASTASVKSPTSWKLLYTEAKRM